MKGKVFCCLFNVFILVALLLQGCAKDDSIKQGGVVSGGTPITNSGGTPATNSEGLSAAMGRFMEEEIALPVSIKILFDLRCGGDDVIRALFENEPGSLCLYESSDEGANWSRRKLGMGWLPKNYRVGAACLDSKGNIFACAGKMSEDPMARKNASGMYRYFRIDKSGKTKEILLELPEAKDEYTSKAYGISKPALSEDGKLYGMLDLTEERGRRQGRLFCFDIKSGKKLWSTDVEDTGMQLFGGQLYVYISDKKELKHIDIKTGKELGETECPFDLNCIDIKSEKNKVYGVDRAGIYGTDSQMEVRELLVDGALGCFSGEEYMFDRLACVSEDVFLLVLGNMTGEKELFRYQYEPDIPTRPDNELRVYTLKDNSVMRTLVSDFRKKYPEIYVRYEVGMDGSNAKNVSDAINTLNTETLAGNGPDVLALNNLPWKSYAEKGMLAELGGCYEKNEVFENLFQIYEQEGKSCVVPLSFKIPIAAGDKAAVSSIHSAEDLLKEVEATRKDYLPFTMGKQQLARYVSSVYWQTVQSEDGSLSRENLRRLLEIIKKMQEHVDASTSEYNDIVYSLDDDRTVDHFDTGCTINNDGMASMELTYLDSINSLIYLYRHMKKKDLYDDMSWQVISKGTFSPLLVGISGKAGQMEIAEKFISFCLSEEEQKSFNNPEKLFYGFPVNKKAWKNMIQKPSKSKLKKLGTAFDIWPPQDVFADVEKQITELETPAMEDSVVIDTILDSVMPYMSGKKNLDTAADEIMQTLELYYAE